MAVSVELLPVPEETQAADQAAATAERPGPRVRLSFRVTVAVEVECPDELPNERAAYLAATAVAPVIGTRLRCLGSTARPYRLFVLGTEFQWSDDRRPLPSIVMDG